MAIDNRIMIIMLDLSNFFCDKYIRDSIDKNNNIPLKLWEMSEGNILLGRSNSIPQSC